MHSSEPASTSSTSALEGSKLCSPPSPRSIGLLDDTFIKSGVVDKLVQEFQQYYNESKETDYRIHTSTTSSPFKKPNSSLDTSNQATKHEAARYTSYGKKREARNNKSLQGNGTGNNTSSPQQRATSPTPVSTPPSNPSSPGATHNQAPLLDATTTPANGQNDGYVIDILTKGGKVKHGSIIDVQQQFFKNLTNDLIKTSGSVILKPITSAAQRRELEGSHPPSNPSSPSSSRIYSDDKGFQKRQMSKTLDPPSISRTDSPPPPLSLLSCSAPGHAGSVFSGAPKSPPSPSSSRPLRSSSSSLSPVPSRRSKGSPAAIVADLAMARAALNPAGLPIGYSPPTSPLISPTASPTASPTFESAPPYPFAPFGASPSSFAVSPKPLRPMHAQPSSPRGSRISSPHHLAEENIGDTKQTTMNEMTNNVSTIEIEETNGITASTKRSEEHAEATQTQEQTELITETTRALVETEITAETTPELTPAKLVPVQTAEPTTAPTTAPTTEQTTEQTTEPTAESAQIITEPTQTAPEPTQTISEPVHVTIEPTAPTQTTPELAPQDAPQPTWVQSKVEDIYKPKPYPTRPSASGTMRPLFGSAFLSNTSPTSPSFTPSSSSPAPSSSTSPTLSAQSSLSIPSWTSYRGNSTPQHRTQARSHQQARPMSTIGVVRYSPSSSASPISPSVSTMDPSINSRPAAPFSTDVPPIITSAPDSPSPATPTPTTPRSTSPALQSSTTDLLSAADALLLSSSTSTTPTTPSSLTSSTPPSDPFYLLPPLVLSGGYSPTLSPRGSPYESPRDPFDPSDPRRATESPHGWGVEDIAITTCWRTPTLSYVSGSVSALPLTPSPRIARASVNHHRLNRTVSSAADLNVLSISRASPESPTPLQFSKEGDAVEGNKRPHAGSGGATLPVRSSSDPFVPERAGRSGSLDQDDLTQQASSESKPLPRSLSAWQLTKGSDLTDLEESFSENRSDLLYTHTKAGTKIVKAGTLNALIEVLTFQKQSDPAFVDAFLLTYPSFTTPMMLLEKLIERYNQTAPQDLTPEQRDEYENDNLIVRLRVCSVLKSWADKYFYDFQNEPPLVDKFVCFMDSLKERGMEKVSGTIVRALQKKLDGAEKRIILTHTTPVPSPVMPKGGEITLLNFEDVEVARQLTLMEYESYCCIRPRECLNQAWNKPNRDEESPNIVTMIRRSNSIPLWVATEIIKEDKLQRRVSILKKFINIAEFCRRLNNFNAVMEIISGLNLTPVYRLRKTWDALPRKQIIFFEQLSALMAPKSNFKVYREELHTKNPPCVPFLGRYLTDLTFIEDAAKDCGEGMINFVKRMQLSVVIREIQQYQQTPYNLAVVSGIREYLSKIDSLPENELYAQSRVLEPSTTTS